MEQSVLAADSRVILFFEAVEAAGNMFELEAQQILSDAAGRQRLG